MPDTESTVGRSPVQIAKLTLPRCKNTFGVAPCTATGSGSAKCFNTRATCSDIGNYRQLPDGHLTQSQVNFDLDDLDNSVFTRNADLFFAADVRFGISAAGTIWELGDNSTQGAYLGITSANLIFRAGASGVADGVNTAKISVAASAYEGKSLTLLGEIDVSAGSVTLWAFDPIALTLTQIGTDTASSGFPSSTWAGASDGKVGGDGGTIPTGEDGGAWDGCISEIRFYDSTAAPADMGATGWRQDLYYGHPNQERPADAIFIQPSLMNVTTAPTKVSVGGADRNTDPLGNRASVSVEFKDGPGSDFIVDPYRSERPGDAALRGSYWSKFRVREKFGRVNASVEIFEGYKGQRLAEMQSRRYLMDALDLPSRDRATIKGRDVLSKAELQKAQVPPQSNGVLNAAINTTDLAFSVKNAEVQDYPPAGTVRINKEYITYSARVASGALIDFTVTARGQDRSDEAAHNEDDTVQICRRYTAARVSDVLTELMADDAAISGGFLDLANWDAEDATFFNAYRLTTLLGYPTAVKQLAGEIIEQVGAIMFWDERSQIVSLLALKALTAIPPTITERDMHADSFSAREKPKERVTRVNVYFNPISFAEKLDDATDFLNGYSDVGLFLERPDAYGQPAIRDIFSRWLTTNAQATQTASRIANRYQDTPLEITFAMDAKDRANWIGYTFALDHYQIVDANGNKETDRVFIITSAEDVVPGEVIQYTAEDATLAGYVAFVASNSQGNYTGDPAVDQLYGFITDADGLTSTGAIGSRIT